MSDDTVDMVSKALRRAWSLGQVYWQQADSQYTSQHRKSDETQGKFEALIEETRAALSQSAPQGVAEVSKSYAWDTAALYAKLYHEAKARVAELERDAAAIDWLEAQINEHGAIHLHDGNNPSCHGLGLRPGSMARTLRDAIDSAIAASKETK